ncbi:MAG: ROK family protein, partial [Spirochaetales bacterium]|nr:ROK family protein [Spirochaetales bacterium]
TDVTAAAMAEYQWGAALHEPVVGYLTVGTGIGLGLLVDGRPLPGPARPEFGHIRIPHIPQDLFPGFCQFHGDCLEGLASGPSVALRWGKPGAALPDDHPAWELEASYLAYACATLILTLGNPCIVIGGGVGLRKELLERIRIRTTELLAGYGSTDPEAPKYRIRRAALGEDAGLRGAALLAYHEACSAHAIP